MKKGSNKMVSSKGGMGSPSGTGGNSSMRLKKDIDVVFHGLRLHRQKKVRAYVPTTFMEDKVDVQSALIKLDPVLMMQYREMKKYDSNWGANNINMQELGYAGELSLTDKDYYAREEAMRSGNLPWQTNMVVNNTKDFWAWFNAQKIFESDIDHANNLDLYNLIHPDSKGKVKASDIQNEKRLRKADDSSDTYYFDVEPHVKELQSKGQDSCVVELNDDFITKKRNHMARGGSSVHDSRLYARLTSAFLLPYGVSTSPDSDVSVVVVAMISAPRPLVLHVVEAGKITRKSSTRAKPRHGRRKDRERWEIVLKRH